MQILEVELWRYSLHFHLLPSGGLFCKELGKVMDSNQDSGTFIGLQSRLILTGLNFHQGKYERLVIVPKGKLTWKRLHEGHPQVHIELSDAQAKVEIVQYSIDQLLRRLKCHNDAFSLVYEAHIHALTSHFLPDPLTGHTGIEEAILQLRQRSLCLMQPCEDDLYELLVSLAKLSPARKYMPANTTLTRGSRTLHVRPTR